MSASQIVYLGDLLERQARTVQAPQIAELRELLEKRLPEKPAGRWWGLLTGGVGLAILAAVIGVAVRLASLDLRVGRMERTLDAITTVQVRPP